jgi:hypothetical protein
MVSAVGTISQVEVAGVSVASGSTAQIAGFYRDTIPVRVQFTSTTVEEESRVKMWFSGSRVNAAMSDRFDVLVGPVYSKILSVPLPDDFDDDETSENFTLNVLIESRSGGRVAEQTVSFSVQRESFELDILDVEVSSEVNAGDSVAVDVVLKNRGRQDADDTFVVVRIPSLGIEDRAYFGDLSPVDEANPDKEDAGVRRLFLRLPKSAAPGIYEVEVEAFNADTVQKVTRRVAVLGAGASTMIVAPVHTASVAPGQTAKYQMILVNDGNRVQVYELVVEGKNGLQIQLSDPVVAIPAGTSRTVTASVIAADSGTHTFAVNVHAGGQLVQREPFTLRAEGANVTSGSTVLLIVLAIIFVVLLIVLIVLLTRGPADMGPEGEFGSGAAQGESYY